MLYKNKGKFIILHKNAADICTAADIVFNNPKEDIKGIK